MFSYTGLHTTHQDYIARGISILKTYSKCSTLSFDDYGTIMIPLHLVWLGRKTPHP